jgi:spoIIIJ-associated protein
MEINDVVEMVKTLVKKLGIDADGVEVTEAAGHTLLTIRTKDSGALIGARGDTLSALNHLVKRALEGKGGAEEPRFVVDVNGYHLKHIKNLESQATMLAERARTFQYDIEMSPMSAYDRLIVHSALQNAPDVSTESRGEGKMRHVVIRYSAASPKSADTPESDTL